MGTHDRSGIARNSRAQGGSGDPARWLAGAAWAASAGHYRYSQRRFGSGSPVGRCGLKSGAGRCAAWPMVGSERASFAFRRRDQRGLRRLSRHS